MNRGDGVSGPFWKGTGDGSLFPPDKKKDEETL